MLLLNNQPIDHFLFSGGEFQLKLPNKIESERVILTWKPIDASEITFLLLTINALRYMGINDIDLDILYLPYARQDRICSKGESHSLEVMCDLINRLPVSMVRFWDVHNWKATEELLDGYNIHHTEAVDIFQRYNILNYFDRDNLILCAPDEGAYGRVADIANKFELGLTASMHKERCWETGRITGMRPDKYNRSVDGWNVLIIDDICDGGATFNQCAQILREQGAVNLYLYVTHGIFSKGLDLLQANFQHIYCHHVLHDDKFQSTDKLTILQEHPIVS